MEADKHEKKEADPLNKNVDNVVCRRDKLAVGDAEGDVVKMRRPETRFLLSCLMISQVSV